MNKSNKNISLYAFIIAAIIFVFSYIYFMPSRSLLSTSSNNINSYINELLNESSNNENSPSYASNDHVTCSGSRCLLKKIPNNQKQGSSNLCWAFASLNSLESTLLNHYSSYGFTNSSTKFNKPHMGYSSYYKFKSGTNNEFGTLRQLRSGATLYEITRYYTNGMGPTQSTSFSIDNYANEVLFSKSDIMNASKKYRVTELQFVNGANNYDNSKVQSKVNEIKNLLRNGYGVDITSRSTASRCLCYSDTYKSSYCPQANNPYNNPSASGTCNYHATSIIGWDDNFSNYKLYTGGTQNGQTYPKDSQPPNGAWIVRNSTSSDIEYYISWYDVSSIYQNLTITGVKNELGYDRLYQYYPYFVYESLTGNSSKKRVATIYEKKSSGKNEKLNSVGFFSKCADTFDIYYTDNITAIISGASNYSHIFSSNNKIGSITTSRRGYYTLDLGSNKKTIENTSFIIGISGTKDNCVTQIEEDTSLNNPSNDLKITSGRNYQVDSGVWKDLASYSPRKSNYINAFTSNTSTNSTTRKKITSITISGGNSVTVGSTLQLSTTISPSDASNKLLAWKSSNTSYATVDNNGKVTGVKKGTVTIKAYATDGSGVVGSKEISVTNQSSVINVTGVSVSPTSATLYVGDTKTLTATVTPSNATDKSVTWSSSNTSVATVSSSGKVTAIKAGTATITVRTNDGGKTATCKITVKNSEVPLTDINISPTSMNLEVNESQRILITLVPENATTSSYSFTSSNTGVATVTDLGIVKGISSGNATITVRVNSISKTVTVKVKNPTISVTGVSVSPKKVNLKVGETTTLTATVTPSDASDKTVTWSSSNTSVATVNSSGKVTAKKAGTATITVRTNDGGKTATSTITVKNNGEELTGINVSPTSLNLEVNEQYKLIVTPIPATATINTLNYSSSNTSVATVTSSGIVKGVSSGTATITIIANGNIRKTVSVTVKKQVVSVTGVSISPSILNLKENETYTLTATVTPSNATNKSVTWSSSNTSVATVSSSGKVTAKSSGTATITVRTNDGGKTSTCKVNVSKVVTMTTYTVEHYKEKLDGKYPSTPTEKETLNGTVGSQISPNPKSYQGFVEPKVQTIVLVDNSSNKVKYYYKRKTYNITLVKGEGIKKVYGSGSYKYESNATIKAEALDNYEFSNWSINNKTINTNSYTFKVTSDQEYIANAKRVVVNPTISLNNTEIVLVKNDTFELKANITGDDKDITWSSEDTGIASVNNGIIKANKVGSTTIKATLTGTNIFATCLVKVIDSNEKSVKFSNKVYNVYIGEEKDLSFIVTPSSMNIDSIKYIISNKNIVSIKNRKVKGLKIGSTSVKAIINNKYETTTTIYVIEKPLKVNVVGYNLKFDEKTYQYSLKIDSDIYSLEIESNKGVEILGNDYLENGSIITIIDLKTKKEYKITIKKDKTNQLKTMDKDEIMMNIIGICIILVLMISSFVIIFKKKKRKFKK